ncbi:hypothetical protein M9458_050317, partial [Cirrhinus mrigala]
PTPVVSWVKLNGDVPGGRASFLNFDKTLRITDNIAATPRTDTAPFTTPSESRLTVNTNISTDILPPITDAPDST